VVPSAGPPCVWIRNARPPHDGHGRPANIFPDQVVSSIRCAANGHDRGARDPGSDGGLRRYATEALTHPVPHPESTLHHDKAALIGPKPADVAG